MKRLISISFIMLITVCSMGCYNDKYDKLYPSTDSTATSCDTSGTISYSKNIAPIIQNNCYSSGNGCHDVAGSIVSGYNFTSYAGLLANIQSGALLNDINFTPLRGDNDMPKNTAQLPQCDIDQITRWINEGYPDN